MDLCKYEDDLKGIEYDIDALIKDPNSAVPIYPKQGNVYESVFSTIETTIEAIKKAKVDDETLLNSLADNFSLCLILLFIAKDTVKFKKFVTLGIYEFEDVENFIKIQQQNYNIKHNNKTFNIIVDKSKKIISDYHIRLDGVISKPYDASKNKESNQNKNLPKSIWRDLEKLAFSLSKDRFSEIRSVLQYLESSEKISLTKYIESYCSINNFILHTGYDGLHYKSVVYDMIDKKINNIKRNILSRIRISLNSLNIIEIETDESDSYYVCELNDKRFKLKIGVKVDDISILYDMGTIVNNFFKITVEIIEEEHLSKHYVMTYLPIDSNEHTDFMDNSIQLLYVRLLALFSNKFISSEFYNDLEEILDNLYSSVSQGKFRNCSEILIQYFYEYLEKTVSKFKLAHFVPSTEETENNALLFNINPVNKDSFRYNIALYVEPINETDVIFSIKGYSKSTHNKKLLFYSKFLTGLSNGCDFVQAFIAIRNIVIASYN